MEKYPTIATPNISAVMAAAVANTNQRLKDEDTNHLQSFEPADVVSVSMSPSDQSEYAEDNNGSTVSKYLYRVSHFKMSETKQVGKSMFFELWCPVASRVVGI